MSGPHLPMTIAYGLEASRIVEVFEVTGEVCCDDCADELLAEWEDAL